MKNKNIIEIGEGGIQCDNPNCDYTIPADVSEYGNYLNKPCPKCGENLLTQEDFDAHSKVLKTIEFANSLTEDQLKHLAGLFEIDTTGEQKEISVMLSVDNGIPNFKIVEE